MPEEDGDDTDDDVGGEGDIDVNHAVGHELYLVGRRTSFYSAVVSG